MLNVKDLERSELARSFLKYSIVSYFARERYVDRFVAKIRKKGIKSLENLVSMTEEEVFNLVPTSDKNKSRINAALRRVDLEFKPHP
jgi:hypothetical protein